LLPAGIAAFPTGKMKIPAGKSLHSSGKISQSIQNQQLAILPESPWWAWANWYLCATLNLRVLYARWRANRPPETANSMAQTQPMAKKSKWMGRLCQCIAQVWENLLAPGAVSTCPRQIYPPKSFTPSSVKNLLRRSQRCRILSRSTAYQYLFSNQNLQDYAGKIYSN
jgi:hypothetical protein